jgi:hypothetical protein
MAHRPIHHRHSFAFTVHVKDALDTVCFVEVLSADEHAKDAWEALQRGVRAWARDTDPGRRAVAPFGDTLTMADLVKSTHLHSDALEAQLSLQDILVVAAHTKHPSLSLDYHIPMLEPAPAAA